jgi:predicted HicB family RNase H-like nuclease
MKTAKDKSPLQILISPQFKQQIVEDAARLEISMASYARQAMKEKIANSEREFQKAA